MNLLFTLNRRYFDILRVCLHSVVRFETRGGYDVYILASDLNPDDFDMLAKEFPDVRFYPIDVDESRFSAFPESKLYPKQMYYRILAAKLLPERLDGYCILIPTSSRCTALTSCTIQASTAAGLSRRRTLRGRSPA